MHNTRIMARAYAPTLEVFLINTNMLTLNKSFTFKLNSMGSLVCFINAEHVYLNLTNLSTIFIPSISSTLSVISIVIFRGTVVTAHRLFVEVLH